MTEVGGACIDRYEAHLVLRREDGSFTPHLPHERPTGGTFVARSARGVRPQSYISRVEAALACEHAGKRLCSVSEWFRACSGPRKTQYPYGDAFEEGRCNVGKSHLLSLRHGKDPRAWKYDEHFNDPELCQAPGFLGRTGEHAGCVSVEGAFDLVGNLHEWVADRVDPSLAGKLPLTEGIRRRLGSNTGKGVFMGGFFSTTNEHGRGCSFVTAAHEPSYHDYSTGFRCCRELDSP
jgi:formylglycine-generating enzyme required for sulfatase activity